MTGDGRSGKTWEEGVGEGGGGIYTNTNPKEGPARAIEHKSGIATIQIVRSRLFLRDRITAPNWCCALAPSTPLCPLTGRPNLRLR